MQVFNTPQFSTYNTKPNFKAIRTVKCEGLYKKYPELGKELVETFRANPAAMDFCKKYDVDIIFDACKRAITAVESSIHIVFDNPAKKKFLGIFGSQKDRIHLSNYNDAYEIPKSIKESTEGLKDYISPSIPGRTSGLLDAHINYKEEDIQKVLDERKEILAKKLDENKKAEQEKTKQEIDKQSLADSVSELIKSSK